mgnify:CR=1 FL=1
MSKVKLKDIAKKAGVSISTVSRAINRPEMVKESTRIKVLKVVKKMDYKPRVSRRTTLNDIAKVAGVSRSTVSRVLNRPEMVKVSTRNKVLKAIKKMGYKPRVRKRGLISRRSSVAEKYLEYKNYMATKPNDTVHKRWGMYTHDARYKDYTASIVKMIMDDMKINIDQAYYMLYYMVSNDIDDYERAKRDMMVDPNFEIYRDKRRKRR